MQLHEDQWRKLEALIPGRKGCAGPPGKNNRLFIEAVILISERRFAWRELPSRYGEWNTAYMRFRRWNISGVWSELENAVVDDPALLPLIQGIRAYSRWCQSQLEKKARRRKYRENFSHRINATEFSVPTENNRPNFPDEDIVSDWVTLVEGYSPSIL